MTEHTVELDFGSLQITKTVNVGMMANDDVVVEVARSEVVDERSDLGRFHSGRVVA